MFVKESELRREAYRLIMTLKTKGISSLLVWESPQMAGGSFSITEVGLSFLVDCIVALKPVEIESSLRKALVVLKMRGSDHDKRLREFQITSTGIKIESAFTNYEGVITGSPRKVASEKFVDLFRGAAEKRKGGDRKNAGSYRSPNALLCCGSRTHLQSRRGILRIQGDKNNRLVSCLDYDNRSVFATDDSERGRLGTDTFATH